MKKTSSNTLSPSFSLAGLNGFVFFDGILKQVLGLQKFYSSSQSFFQSQLEFFIGKSNGLFQKKLSNAEVFNHKSCANENEDDGKLSREDVKMVLGKLNIAWNQEGEMLQERLGMDELSKVFEEEEPSLAEVKEAFDVFDENKDGFVDATELQRLLSGLGFGEGSQVAACEKMISVFDVNKDGLIDFNEFVKLMEKTFC